MSKIKELFGIYCNDTADFKRIVSQQLCPYSRKKCYKIRKSQPELSIGTCTIQYQEKNIIICPNRLLENNHIHSYDFKESSNKLKLFLETRISTDSAGIAKSLGLNAQPKVELEELIKMLEQKLIDESRLSIV